MHKLNLKEIADKCGYNNVYNESEKQINLFDSLQKNLIDSLINKYIIKSLLSHWKSAVENIVLETRQYKFKNYCKETSYTNPKVIKIMNVALYKIFIKEKELFEYGYTLKDKYNWVDVIVINEEMTIKEKRCVVAHELAHIIIDRILKENIDINNLESEIDQLKDKWEKRHEKLAFYIEHDELEKVETNLTGLKGEIEGEEYGEVMSRLDQSVFLLEHIEDKYKFNLQNIF